METKNIIKLNHHEEREKQLAHYFSCQGTELEQFLWLHVMRNRAKINSLKRKVEEYGKLIK